MKTTPSVYVTILLAVMCAAAIIFLHERRSEHEQQLSAARSHFSQLDRARNMVLSIIETSKSDHDKLDAARNAALDASQKRVDDENLGSFAELANLAHRERINIELMQSLDSNLADNDETMIEVFRGVYGANAVSELKRDVASLTEARADAALMWWRAADTIEKDNKQRDEDFMRELQDPNYAPSDTTADSSDETVREYDESSRYDNTADSLQRIVDDELADLTTRLNSDWKNAKAAFASLSK